MSSPHSLATTEGIAHIVIRSRGQPRLRHVAFTVADVSPLQTDIGGQDAVAIK